RRRHQCRNGYDRHGCHCCVLILGIEGTVVVRVVFDVLCVAVPILIVGPHVDLAALTIAAEELRSAEVLFKAPRTLSELFRLNCGYFYGSSQIGKFLTVYPATPEDAAQLAARLDKLTRGIAGPNVP